MCIKRRLRLVILSLSLSFYNNNYKTTTTTRDWVVGEAAEGKVVPDLPLWIGEREDVFKRSSDFRPFPVAPDGSSARILYYILYTPCKESETTFHGFLSTRAHTSHTLAHISK